MPLTKTPAESDPSRTLMVPRSPRSPPPGVEPRRRGSDENTLPVRAHRPCFDGDGNRATPGREKRRRITTSPRRRPRPASAVCRPRPGRTQNWQTMRGRPAGAPAESRCRRIDGQAQRALVVTGVVEAPVARARRSRLRETTVAAASSLSRRMSRPVRRARHVIPSRSIGFGFH